MRGALVYLVLLLPIGLLCFGARIFLDPYTTVPDQVVPIPSQWNAGIPGDHPVAFFTIRSKGIFTANYNITINISVTLPKRTAEFCKGKMMNISIPGARLNPTDLNAATILLHEMPGLAEARFGSGTIIFPYPGNFTYRVLIGNESMGRSCLPENKDPIFVIENYSARLQIENANRNMGIALISLSVAALSIMVKPLWDYTKRPNLSVYVSYSPSIMSPHGSIDFYRISLKNARRYWTVHPVENARVTIVFLRKERNGLKEVLHIPAKWDSTLQPIVPGSGTADVRLFPQAEVHDIDPRVNEPIALCMKSQGEDAIYAFNAESYLYGVQGYRNPKFRLEKGEYQVQIILKARNAYKEFKLLLKNNGPYFKDVTIAIQK